MPKEINEIVSVPALIVLAGWLLRELYAFFKDKSASHAQALKENTAELKIMTISMAKLEVKFEMIERLVTEIPKIKQDLNAFHSFKRSVEKTASQADALGNEQ